VAGNTALGNAGSTARTSPTATARQGPTTPGATTWAPRPARTASAACTTTGPSTARSTTTRRSGTTRGRAASAASPGGCEASPSPLVWSTPTYELPSGNIGRCRLPI
jgi:hypothetical protein